MLSYIHGRSQRKHRLLFLLAGINIRRQFWISEHIHNAVITDSVPASKVPVGVVIRHAPAKASRDIRLKRHLI